MKEQHCSCISIHPRMAPHATTHLNLDTPTRSSPVGSLDNSLMTSSALAITRKLHFGIRKSVVRGWTRVEKLHPSSVDQLINHTAFNDIHFCFQTCKRVGQGIRARLYKRENAEMQYKCRNLDNAANWKRNENLSRESWPECWILFYWFASLLIIAPPPLLSDNIHLEFKDRSEYSSAVQHAWVDKVWFFPFQFEPWWQTWLASWHERLKTFLKSCDPRAGWVKMAERRKVQEMRAATRNRESGERLGREKPTYISWNGIPEESFERVDTVLLGRSWLVDLHRLSAHDAESA